MTMTTANEDLFIASHDTFESGLLSKSSWGSTAIDDNDDGSLGSRSIYTEISEAYDNDTYVSFQRYPASASQKNEEMEEEEYDNESNLMKAMDWANEVPAIVCQPFETACAPLADLGANQNIQKDVQYSLLMNSSASPQTSKFFNSYSKQYSSRLLKSARREDTQNYLSRIHTRISLQQQEDLLNVGQKTLMSKAVRKKNPRWNSKVVKKIRASNKNTVGPSRVFGEDKREDEEEERSTQHSQRKENIEERNMEHIRNYVSRRVIKDNDEEMPVDRYQSRADEEATLLEMLDKLLDDEQMAAFQIIPQRSSLKKSSSDSKKSKSEEHKRKSKKNTKKVRIIG